MGKNNNRRGDNKTTSDRLSNAEDAFGLSDKEKASFNSDAFGRVKKLSKVELVTLIATATVAGVAHGACACGY